jgi:serine/threonine-protein kinase
MAPEQIRSKPVDARSDVWALGVVLYELCTGQTPFAADSVPSVCHLVLNEKPTPPRTFAPDLPLALEGIILRCLEKEPDHRFANVGELAAVLSAFGGPEAAYYADRVERVLRVGPGSPGRVTTDRRQRQGARCPDVRVVLDDSRPDLKTQPSLEFPRSYPRPRTHRGQRAVPVPSSKARLSLARPAIYVGLAVGIALGAGIGLGSTRASTRPAVTSESAIAAVALPAGPVTPIAEPISVQQVPVLTSTLALEELPSTPVEKPARAASSARHRVDAWDRRNFGGRR